MFSSQEQESKNKKRETNFVSLIKPQSSEDFEIKQYYKKDTNTWYDNYGKFH